MSRMYPDPFVDSDDADDVEVGAYAQSATCFDALGNPAGGIVIRVELDVDDAVLSVTVVRIGRGGYPDTQDIVRSDLDMPATRFSGDEARGMADSIARWLSGPRAPKDRYVADRWYAVVGDLRQAGTAGIYTPQATLRQERLREQQRREAS